MRTYRTLFPTLALLLALVVPQASLAQHHEHAPAEKKQEEAGMKHGQMKHEGMHHGMAADSLVVHPEVIDGVQVVEIEVGPMGYSASQIALQAGVPARLVFTRTKEGGCMHQVQVPAFGIAPTDLPVGEPVAVEFTPEEAGTYTFACGMDMMKGALLVKG